MKKIVLICLLVISVFAEVKKEYYANGILESEKQYNNGKEEGLSKFYRENGSLQAIVTYKSGKQEGLGKFYRANGNLEMAVLFKNGLRNGLSKGYHQNGNLEYEIIYKNGKVISGYLYSKKGEKTKLTKAIINQNN